MQRRNCGAVAVKVLLGECTGRRVPIMKALGWGRMWIARGRNIYTYPGEPWGFDNGAFRDWSNRPAPMLPEMFDAPAYWERLAAAQDHPAPWLAVVPDLPGSPHSLAYSLRWRDSLPSWPWFLAVQDGTTPEHVLPYANGFAGIFLGGTDRYKATAGEWGAFARETGLRFHYGRAGTLSKVAHAIRAGAHSLDSAFPMWTESRWRVFTDAIRNGPPQHELQLERRVA